MKVSKSEFAKSLGLTKGRVSQLISKGLPLNADGSVSLDKAKSWYEGTVHKGARKRGPSKSENVPTAVRLLEAQTKKEEQLAILREMEVARRRGELVPLSDVEVEFSRMLTTFRNRVLLVPDKIAPRVVSLKDILEIREICRREIYDCLTELSNYDPSQLKEQSR